jgi:hypothetical protein
MNSESRLAVLESEQRGIQNALSGFSFQLSEHKKEDKDSFDRQFLYMRGMKEEILDTIGGAEDCIAEKVADILKGRAEDRKKLDLLWDERSERNGAFRFSGIIAHCLTFLISIGVTLGIIKAIK